MPLKTVVIFLRTTCLLLVGRISSLTQSMIDYICCPWARHLILLMCVNKNTSDKKLAVNTVFNLLKKLSMNLKSTEVFIAKKTLQVSRIFTLISVHNRLRSHDIPTVDFLTFLNKECARCCSVYRSFRQMKNMADL